jgi:putative nucleotidyltransferase with HDIG domain
MSLTCALLRTLELRDLMTARHSIAVAGWTRRLAAAAGFSEWERELAQTAGLLHDIGKLSFPDRILRGDADLTGADWEHIRMHPGAGARVVAGIDGYETIAEIILTHHERMDGRGYPRGLPAEGVPAIARMIAVADTYDAMTSRDSYRPPVSHDEAIAELKRVAGTQLDPNFVELFIETRAGDRVPQPIGSAAI